MSEAWRFHLLASARTLTDDWPSAARAGFHDAVMQAPDSWRPDGDDDAERAAGGRALARAWIAIWRAVDRAPTPGSRAPGPVRAPGVARDAVPVPASDAEADELAALWRLLGRELTLAAWKRR